MGRSADIVRKASIDIYNIAYTQKRSLLTEKLDLIYHEVELLEHENRILLERLQQVESERFNWML